MGDLRGYPLEEDSELKMHYGSVLRAMLSFFKASTGGDDWSTFYEPLEPLTALDKAFFLFCMAFIQIAAWNIILGIFVDDAMKCMASGNQEKAKEFAREQL